MSPPRRASLLQTGVVLTTALYQKRRNEIWCNVMWWWSIAGKCWPGLKQTGSGSPLHWSLRRVDTPRADNTWPVYLSVCICACAIWWSSPKAITKGASNTRRFTSPWEKRRRNTDLAGGWTSSAVEKTGGECQASSNVYPTPKDPVSSHVQPSATRMHFIQRYRFMITHTHTEIHTHTVDVIAHAAL